MIVWCRTIPKVGETVRKISLENNDILYEMTVVGVTKGSVGTVVKGRITVVAEQLRSRYAPGMPHSIYWENTRFRRMRSVPDAPAAGSDGRRAPPGRTGEGQ